MMVKNQYFSIHSPIDSNGTKFSIVLII
ncbi:hypothetical protein BLA29_014391 [Euroglyphus maynei]|uniref:Uncharacterized protein n=1 Tax=Euroglyphus maynei TaxID=6958 RepID=A0A1Y3AVN0_EURMA|nr:hypothetical protein BLA29_014391 [Euroglyphus maynei]